MNEAARLRSELDGLRRDKDQVGSFINSPYPPPPPPPAQRISMLRVPMSRYRGSHAVNEAARLRSELDGLRRDQDQVGSFINSSYPPPPTSPCPENFNAESTNAKIQKSHAVNEAARLRSELDGLRRDKDQVGSFINSSYPPPPPHTSPCPENFNAESTNAKIQKSHAMNEAARLRSELDGLRRDKDQVGSFINSSYPPPPPPPPPTSPCPENFNAESTNAKIQKSHAVNEAARLRSELDGLRRDKDQVGSFINSSYPPPPPPPAQRISMLRVPMPRYRRAMP